MVRQVLSEAWQEVLGRDSVCDADNWFSSGADSMDSLRLLDILRARIDEELPIAVIFPEPPTLQAMIAALDDHLRARGG